MTLSDIALKRPVGSFVMSIVIILFGGVGFHFLGVRLYPAIDPPTISVQTNYTGANAEIIESQITEPLEKALNGIEGVKSITSSSATGSPRPADVGSWFPRRCSRPTRCPTNYIRSS